jgi:restriction system protein
MYEDIEILEEPFQYATYGACPACGWWLIDKIVECTTRHNVWNMHFGASGALKTLDVRNVELPLEEVRRYLTARYDSRFGVHPRKFEEVVASVFKSLGYDSHVTAYTGDGGIDAVLTDSSGSSIGIQVKRSKNRIKAEQIRAFLGALTIAGRPKGVFVTTSCYQSGARACADAATRIGTAIKLVDADRFFDLLKIAQIREFNCVEIPLDWLKAKELKLQPVCEWPLGSI